MTKRLAKIGSLLVVMALVITLLPAAALADIPVIIKPGETLNESVEIGVEYKPGDIRFDAGEGNTWTEWGVPRWLSQGFTFNPPQVIPATQIFWERHGLALQQKRINFTLVKPARLMKLDMEGLTLP